jgi:hypothetical protein
MSNHHLVFSHCFKNPLKFYNENPPSMRSFFLWHNQQIKEVIASLMSFMHSKENEVRSFVVEV